MTAAPKGANALSVVFKDVMDPEQGCKRDTGNGRETAGQ